MDILSYHVFQRLISILCFIMESSFMKKVIFMTKTEAVIRSIIGAVGMDIRPLAYSVDIAIDLMFVQGVPMDDILVTEDIYPEVAKLVKNRKGKIPSFRAISKRIQRLANLCWDTLVAKDLVLEYLGAPLPDIRAPRDVIFYLAFYVRLDTPFFAAVQQQPALLF